MNRISSDIHESGQTAYICGDININLIQHEEKIIYQRLPKCVI